MKNMIGGSNKRRERLLMEMRKLKNNALVFKDALNKVNQFVDKTEEMKISRFNYWFYRFYETIKEAEYDLLDRIDVVIEQLKDEFGKDN